MDQDIKISYVSKKKREAVIKIIGVGGGGGNALNRMIDEGLSGVDIVVINTYCQDLSTSKSDCFNSRNNLIGSPGRSTMAGLSKNEPFGGKTMRCLSKQEIKNYAWKGFDDEQKEFELYEHINGCDKCLNELRFEKQLKFLFKYLTAIEQDKIHRKKQEGRLNLLLKECLGQLPVHEKNPQISEALTQWQQNVNSRDTFLIRAETGEGNARVLSIYKEDQSVKPRKTKVLPAGIKPNADEQAMEKFSLESGKRIYVNSDAEKIEIYLKLNSQLLSMLLTEKGNYKIGTPEKLPGSDYYRISFDIRHADTFFIFFDKETAISREVEIEYASPAVFGMFAIIHKKTTEQEFVNYWPNSLNKTSTIDLPFLPGKTILYDTRAEHPPEWFSTDTGKKKTKTKK